MGKITSFTGEYRFLSNSWPVTIWTAPPEFAFPTLEHAFQASKTLDPMLRCRFHACVTPGQAKRMGRIVDLRPDWESIKIQVMASLVAQKFMQPHLRDMLLATGDAELIEGNTWNDCFWGQCGGVGENYLGKILMQARESLCKSRLL